MAEGIMMQPQAEAQERRGFARLKWLLDFKPSYVVVVTWALGEFLFGLSLLVRPEAEAIYQQQLWQVAPDIPPLLLMAGATLMVAGYALFKNLAGAFIGMLPFIWFAIVTIYQAMYGEGTPISQVVTLVMLIMAFFISLYAAEKIETMQQALARLSPPPTGATNE